VSNLSSAIAAASNEQSVALREVNSAVTQMDTVTQQNAAMVEQTTAAASLMRQNADDVGRFLSRLKLDEQHQAKATKGRQPGTPPAQTAAA
jgi:methyl-accepting chemotaxis protein